MHERETIKVLNRILRKLPARIDMERAIKAKSHAGAGHTIGHNSLLKESRKIITSEINILKINLWDN